jgi:hypothetical protein
MTTTVQILAHLASTKEVKVTVHGTAGTVIEEFSLQDGETAERYVYDDRQITVKEADK